MTAAIRSRWLTRTRFGTLHPLEHEFGGQRQIACLQNAANLELEPPPCGEVVRVYRGLEELTYPFHDHTIAVTRCGRICFKGRKVNLSHVLAGQNVGVTQVGERIWLVTFMQYDLGYFDDETCRLEPIENPFGPKVLPIRSE